VLSRIEFMFLGLVWGASFALYRVAIPELGLAVTVALRLLLAATALCLVFGSPLRRIPMGDRRRSLVWIVLIGAGTTALPFSLFAETVMRSSAGFAAVLNASSPLFSALLAACVWRESLSGSKAVGLMLGFAGVALLASLRELGPLRIGVDAVLLGLVGAASYGLCVQLTRRKLGTLDSSAVATGFSVVGAVLLLPWALLSLPPAMPSWPAVLAVLVLGLVSTALGNFLYFRLLGRMGATPALSVTFLIPPFAMLWGNVLFDEVPTFAMLASTVIILVGTALSLGWRRTPS
jgi:drug/metabolite transporter (DMT)-like permease